MMTRRIIISMEVNAFLAQAVTGADGILNAVGIGVRLMPARVPGMVGPVAVGALIEFVDGELGNHQMMVRVLGPDGKRVPITPEGEDPTSTVNVTEPSVVAANFGLQVPVAAAGTHRIEIIVDGGKATAVVPLEIVGVQAPADPESEPSIGVYL